MRIIHYISEGLKGSLRCWKWIIAYWLLSALVFSLISVPVKTSVKSITGSSLITERLSAGFPADVIGNSGAGFDNVLSSLVPGTFIAMFITLLLNAFFTGGFFTVLRAGSDTDLHRFFGNAAQFFWRFLRVYILTISVLFVLALLILGLPVAIGYNFMGSTIVYISLTAYFLAASLIISVADFSRSFIVTGGDSPGIYRAVGSGIKAFTAGFLTNYSAILLIIIIQVLFASLFVFFIVNTGRSAGSGFMLFAGGHLFIIIKVFLRCWRYGTVIFITENQISAL